MDQEDLEDLVDQEDLGVDHLMSVWVAWVVLVDHWHWKLAVLMVGVEAQWVVSERGWCSHRKQQVPKKHEFRPFKKATKEVTNK